MWLARSVLGTLRAVKIVRRAAFNNPRPFEREFAGIQRVEPLSSTHDGLVDILQVGRNVEEEFFYYVMELADPMPGPASGPSRYIPRSLASELAARRSLPVAECIQHFHGLALALAHLHRAGLVHRDIKPSNIIFVGGTAKFADVGLVASADDSLSYVGTEGFIPPEGAGTTRADIFSLGKVLYKAATGRDRHDFPSLPLDREDDDKNRGLLELNALWLRACATSPADRYPSADDLAADLALLQAGRSVKHLRRVERRLRQATQLAVAVAILAGLAMAAGVMAQRRASQERETRQQEELLRRRAEVAERSAQDRLGESRIAQARAILQTRKVVATLDTNYFSLSFRPGHAQAAVEYTNGEVVLHQLADWRRLATWASSTNASIPRWSPDGSRLLMLGPSGQLQIVHGDSHRVQPFETLDATLQAISWHPQPEPCSSARFFMRKCR